MRPWASAVLSACWKPGNRWGVAASARRHPTLTGKGRRRSRLHPWVGHRGRRGRCTCRLVGEGPRVFQPLPAGAPDGIELFVGQELGVDAEVAAKLVEKDMHHVASRLGAGARQWFAVACPFVVVGGEFVEAVVGQAQLSGLFEVGHRDPPAALEIGPHAIGDDIAQRAGDLLPRDVLVSGLLVAGEELEARPAERFRPLRVRGSRRSAVRPGFCSW